MRKYIKNDILSRLPEEETPRRSRGRRGRGFARRVLAAFEQAPAWQPATKRGVAVESEHLLIVALPKGKKLPKEPYIIML